MTCLIITGFQRAGTTVLGESMGLASDVAYWGEVFHPEGLNEGPRADALRLRPAGNYFRFRREALGYEALCDIPTSSGRNREWDNYLERLEQLQPGALHVLNVKYSSWHNLNLAWQNPSEPPFLLSLAIERGYPIFHCLRRNRLAQALSESVALLTDIWHVPAGLEPPPAPQPVEIEPAFVLRRLRTCVAETLLYQNWLGASHSTEVWYEDLFGADGRFSPRFDETIRRHVPNWRSQRDPPLRKIDRGASASIANIDALRMALRASEFAEFADEVL